MRHFLLPLALLVGQFQSSEPATVVRLTPPKASAIPASDNGDLIELLNAPRVVGLPSPLPKPDSQGNAWQVDVMNLGPNDVTIQGGSAATPQPGAAFQVLLHPNDRVRIRAAGYRYEQVGR